MKSLSIAAFAAALAVSGIAAAEAQARHPGGPGVLSREAPRGDASRGDVSRGPVPAQIQGPAHVQAHVNAPAPAQVELVRSGRSYRHAPRHPPPRHYGRHDYRAGSVLPRGPRYYPVYQYRHYGLPRPGRGQYYVHTGSRILLVSDRDGRILRVIRPRF